MTDRERAEPSSDRSEPPGPTWQRTLLWIFLAALSVRLLYLVQYSQSPFWLPALDSLYHDLQARELAQGREPAEPYFRAPLYVWMLGAIYRLAGPNYWAARLVQATLGAGSCVLAAQLGRAWFGDRRVGWVAGGLLALYGPLVFFEGELHTPVLEVFLTLAFLFAAGCALNAPTVVGWLGAGLVSGLAAITRPNALVGLPLTVAAAVAPRYFGGAAKGPSVLIRCAALFLGILIPVGGVTLRNVIVSGDPVFIASQGGINFFLGNRPDADGITPTTPRRYAYTDTYRDSVELFGRRAAEEAAGRPLKASEAQSYWVRQGLAWWSADLGGALRLTFKKLVLAFTHREIRNNHSFDFVRSRMAPVLWAFPIGYGLVAPLGLVAMVRSARRRPETRLPTLFAGLYTVSFVLFFVADRFRLPVAALLTVFAASLLVSCTDAFRGRAPAPPRSMAVALIAAALLVWVDWYPTRSPRADAMDWFSAGNRLREMRRPDEAEGYYREAARLDPTNVDVRLNHGASLWDQGRAGEAEAIWRAALATAPGAREHPSLNFNLAMAALEGGRVAEARALLAKTLALDPNHAGARRELDALPAASPPTPATP